MDITPYVEQLRRDLSQAAEIGGEQGRASARLLLLALEPSTRLALMEAISQAAAEISAELPSGSVDVRLSGSDLDFVIDLPAVPSGPPPAPPTPPVAPSAPGSPDEPDDDGTLARVTLRLPDPVKKRAEERASDAGQSLNTWLVNAVRAAAQGTPVDSAADHRSSHSGAHRLSGWL